MESPDGPGARGPFEARYLAFLETITHLRPSLHRYCSRMTGSVLDGEDVVQDALFQAYRKLDTFDDARPLAPWLFRIAHNRCVDFLRRRGVREEAEAGAPTPDSVVTVDPPGPALGRALEHLVLTLPPMERACVLLKDVFDYSLEDIAELVGSTVGGVKAALHRGRKGDDVAPANAAAPREERRRRAALTSLRRAIQSTRLGRSSRADRRRRAPARGRPVRRPTDGVALLRRLPTDDSSVAAGRGRRGRRTGNHPVSARHAARAHSPRCHRQSHHADLGLLVHAVGSPGGRVRRRLPRLRLTRSRDAYPTPRGSRTQDRTAGRGDDTVPHEVAAV